MRITHKKEITMVRKRRKKKRDVEASDAHIRCGLCGKTTNLTKTECCNQWICNDQDQYVLFSYAQNSCYRNHERYTLCSHHYNEQHVGCWKDCKDCMKNFETEMYVWFGTNEFNFEKLLNPPKYTPKRCAECKKIIRLIKDGYTVKGDQYSCLKCSGFDLK